MDESFGQLSPPDAPESTKVKEKSFSKDELQKLLLGIWQNLYDMEEALPFRVPVDPVLLCIPDYFTIVKKPMDLQTIRTKLEQGVYTNPWEFCDDMYLMFDNAWKYNRKNSKVYNWCSTLAEHFAYGINPSMRKMGYCCGQKLTIPSLPLFCNERPMCEIGRDREYYLYETGSSQFGVSKKYIYCLKCFDDLPEGGINLSETLNESNIITKSKFVQMKNDQIKPEPFEWCKICGRKWHRICASYNMFPEGFICDTCITEKSGAKISSIQPLNSGRVEFGSPPIGETSVLDEGTGRSSNP